MTINTTDLENQVIKAFGKCEYSNGDHTETTWLWSIQEHSGLSGKVFSGVCSSLSKKGLFDSYDNEDRGNPDDMCAYLTNSGIAVYESLK